MSRRRDEPRTGALVIVYTEPDQAVPKGWTMFEPGTIFRRFAPGDVLPEPRLDALVVLPMPTDAE